MSETPEQELFRLKYGKAPRKVTQAQQFATIERINELEDLIFDLLLQENTKKQTNKERNKMKITVTESVFLNAFRDSGRWGQFSYDALCALFEYFEQLDYDCGEDSELDPVAICCDWSEYDSATEWAQDYYTDEQFRAEIEGMDDEEQEEHFLETLRNETQVLELSDGSVVVQAF